MRLVVNGEPRESGAADLAALLRAESEAQGLAGLEGLAVALNGRVVRRAEWPATPLSPGDRVEIVRAMQGG